jgi:tol-pal system protein YbgF
MDLGELREATQKAHSAVRVELAEARSASGGNQREIEVLKGKIDELLHQRQAALDPTEEKKGFLELSKRTQRLEAESRMRGMEVRGLQEDMKALRDDLRAQKEEVKSLRASLAKSPMPFPFQALTTEQALEEGRKRMEKKDYRGAIEKFAEVLEKSSKGEAADRAHFWMGESYSALKDFERAILAFQEVVHASPKSNLVSAAFLKQGFAFYDLGHVQDAKLVWEKLIQEYPETEESGTARARLKALEKGAPG